MQIHLLIQEDLKANYELIRESKSDIDGIPTERYTFAKPCIISVAQDFVEDVNTIQVTAFGKTESLLI